MLRKIVPSISNLTIRQCSSSTSGIQSNENIVPNLMCNRNPRNLERLRIAHKPTGYGMDKPGRSFWHKLLIKNSSRHVLASITHYKNGTVIEASTSEWPIRKQLYNPTDTSAYINLARVLAQRCLMMGITEVFCNIKHENSTKLKLFLEELEKNGVTLREPSVFEAPTPHDTVVYEKPWEVHE